MVICEGGGGEGASECRRVRDQFCVAVMTKRSVKGTVITDRRSGWRRVLELELPVRGSKLLLSNKVESCVCILVFIKVISE